jgi:two-component system, cell cycle sensor histidine kinase and response regulator CckA
MSADSDRNLAEAALSEERDTLAKYFETTPAIVLVLDREARIAKLNRAGAEMLEVKAEDVLGRDFFASFVPENLAAWARGHFDSVLAGKAFEGGRMEGPVRTASGGIRVILWSSDVLRDAAGAVVGTIGSGLDITERKRAEHELLLSRASLRSATDAILWIDRHGRLRYANEAAAERLGYTSDELSKLTIFDIDPQTTPESWPVRIERLKARGRVIMETTHRRKDGRTIPVELGATYLMAEGEELVVVVARDLSERRRLEAQFRQAQKMEAVGQLAGGIAHDFNNLLAVLAMQIGLLADAEPGEGRRSMAADMRGTIDRGAALARQLLLFSRRQVMKTERHDLNVLVSNLTKLLRRLLGERITLVTELGAVPLWIEGDSGMLEQVIMNLCVNARDAMPDGGRLVVTAREVTLTEGEAAQAVGGRSERFAHLQVTDSGSGMEPEVVERAFEPFFTTKPAGKGTGLGLATAHGIVAQHDGFMRVESEVGTGSTLHVYLPLVAEGAARAEAAEHHAAPGQRGRILFVEDDSALGTVTARSLRELGYDVVLTANADDALIIWERERGTFDLVLSDMIMPGSMSGLALCRKLCEQDERLRAIILSGYSLELVADDEVAGDRIERLTKPVHLATLAAAMREALAGRGAR